MFRKRFLLGLVFFTIFINSGCQGNTSIGVTQSPAIISNIKETPNATLTPNIYDGLFVDPSQKLGSISPYVYGSNYGPWIAVPAGMIPDAKNAGIRIIRFPGGAWGDHNNLKEYQFDTFIPFCKLLGAIPSISVRLSGGSPEQAAAMVKFVNIDRKYGVKYWSIGNEPDLYTKEINTPYDTPEFNQAWRSIALAMKAVDPTISLIGPEISQFTAIPSQNKKDSAGRDWMTEFLKANGDIVDIVSIHRYPFPVNVSVSVTTDDLRANTKEWTSILKYLKSQIFKITGKNIPVAITEFSSHYNKAVGGDATPDSAYYAIWLGDLLGRFISQDVVIANQWMLTSSGDQGGWGLIGRGELRPSYYTYQMYKMFGNHLLFSSSSDPDVSVYAAETDDSTLTIMMINLSNETKIMPINIKGFKSFSAYRWLLDKDHHAESLPALTVDNNSQVTLPGQSMMLYRIK